MRGHGSREDSRRRPRIGDADSAADLAGLEARGADVDALGGAIDDSANTLDVGVETTLGASVRVGDVVAEAGSLAAHITDRSHGELLVISDYLGDWGVLTASQPDDNRSRIADDPTPTRIRMARPSRGRCRAIASPHGPHPQRHGFPCVDAAVCRGPVVDAS